MTPFSMPKCIGIWGRLLGHKFSFIGGSYVYDNCLRCGMRMQS